MAQLATIFCALAAIASTGAAARSSNSNAPFYGVGRAKDGDSLIVGSREVRLFGIDAPEFDQTCERGGAGWACGSQAADRLSRLVTGRDVRCVQVSTDRYGRSVSRCTVGTTDINTTMVESGYATAYRRYSTDYVGAEASAKAAGRGIWSGNFEAPQQYRVEKRGVHGGAVRIQATDGSSQSHCNIKGNQNRRGQWIYHLPGMPYYDRTRAEQVFCSEAEAQAAGYRRAVVR